MVTSTSSRGRGLVYSKNSTQCSLISSYISNIECSSSEAHSDGNFEDTYEHIKGKNDNFCEQLFMEASTILSSEITSSVNWSILSDSHNMSVFNRARKESRLLDDLCTCNTPLSTWCFIHNKISTVNARAITKSNDFGFRCEIYPSPPLFSPGRVLDCDNLIQWACEAHTIVAATKCPNYRVARIKVPTELNIGNWRAICGNFQDQILLDYLEYGFPLCVDRNNFIHNASVANHPSATQFPHDVDIYFEKELKHKAIVGPRPAFPFPVHYSPLLSRPKPDDTRRIIVNLSFPYGDSVNDRISNAIYDGANFQLKYPSVNNIVEAIHELGPDVLLSKIDVSRAFRNLRVDPADFDLLGLSWKGGS